MLRVKVGFFTKAFQALFARVAQRQSGPSNQCRCGCKIKQLKNVFGWTDNVLALPEIICFLRVGLFLVRFCSFIFAQSERILSEISTLILFFYFIFILMHFLGILRHSRNFSQKLGHFLRHCRFFLKLKVMCFWSRFPKTPWKTFWPSFPPKTDWLMSLRWGPWPKLTHSQKPTYSQGGKWTDDFFLGQHRVLVSRRSDSRNRHRSRRPCWPWRCASLMGVSDKWGGGTACHVAAMQIYFQAVSRALQMKCHDPNFHTWFDVAFSGAKSFWCCRISPGRWQNFVLTPTGWGTALVGSSTPFERPRHVVVAVISPLSLTWQSTRKLQLTRAGGAVMDTLCHTRCP